MIYKRILALFLLLFLLPMTSVRAASAENLNWTPQAGDRLVVDVASNMGYLIHSDGSYLSFMVTTGVKRYVYYIGRYYYAATPVQTWEVQSIDIKDDRVTFGKTGRFLRMYDDGERTSYGIHGYDPIEAMMNLPERYGSRGCIIVTEEILDILESTYHLNGDRLAVETIENFQIEEPPITVEKTMKVDEFQRILDVFFLGSFVI